MLERLKNEFINILESRGWSVEKYGEDYCITLEKSDLPIFDFEVNDNDFVGEVMDYAKTFDPEVYTVTWVEAGGYWDGRESLRDFLNDADLIKKEFDALLADLELAYNDEMGI